MRTDKKFDISGLKFDKRLLEMNYGNKSLTPDEYKSYLAALPDMQDNAEAVQLVDAPQEAAPAASPIDTATPAPAMGAQEHTNTGLGGFGMGGGDTNGGSSSGGTNTPPFGSGY